MRLSYHVFISDIQSWAPPPFPSVRKWGCNHYFQTLQICWNWERFYKFEERFKWELYWVSNGWLPHTKKSNMFFHNRNLVFCGSSMLGDKQKEYIRFTWPIETLRGVSFPLYKSHYCEICSQSLLCKKIESKLIKFRTSGILENQSSSFYFL